VIAFIAVVSLVASIVVADDPTPLPTPPPADCSIVDARAAEAIAGFEVQGPDETSRFGGICYYPSRLVSHDGSLSYAVVTADRLPQRRAFYTAFSRRCAPAVKGTLNELACRQYLKLAVAQTIEEYFAARTGAGDPSPVPGLGDSAVVNGSVLYVRRGQVVFEATVQRGGDFDLARSTELARELLDHASR